MIIIILHFASPLKIEKKSAKKCAFMLILLLYYDFLHRIFLSFIFSSTTYNLLKEEKGEAFKIVVGSKFLEERKKKEILKLGLSYIYL